MQWLEKFGKREKREDAAGRGLLATGNGNGRRLKRRWASAKTGPKAARRDEGGTGMGAWATRRVGIDFGFAKLGLVRRDAVTLSLLDRGHTSSAECPVLYNLLSTCPR